MDADLEYCSSSDEEDVDLRGLGIDAARQTKQKVNDSRRQYKEYLKHYALLYWNDTQGDREPLSREPESKARQLRTRELRQQQEVFCGFNPDGGVRTRSGASRPCAYLSLRTPPSGLTPQNTCCCLSSRVRN